MAKIQGLERVMEVLAKLRSEHLTTIEFAKQEAILKSLLTAVNGDLQLIQETLEMVRALHISIFNLMPHIHNYIAVRNAELATNSSKNTEYLSIMAAIFLPLSLFTV